MIEALTTLAVDKDGLEALQRIFGVSQAADQPTKTLRTPEHRLMLDLLLQAVNEALSTNSTLRRGARAWLRDSPGFSAREAMEVLGYDYAHVMLKLEASWRQHPDGMIGTFQRRADDTCSKCGQKNQ